MFVPRAQVYLGRPSRKGFFSVSSGLKGVQYKHDLKCFEFLRMPCLCPTLFGTFFGILIIFGGIVLCIYGYNPYLLIGKSQDRKGHDASAKVNITQVNDDNDDRRLAVLTYVGPVLMGIGFFVSIVALVLYCEIKDKYVTQVVPDKDVRKYEKDELFDMIVEEFRKNYFRGIEVPLRKRLKGKPKRQMPTLFKALSISTPALLITPEMHRRWQGRDRFLSVSDANSTRSERIRPPRRRESWLKTSSLPNIRPKGSALKDPQRSRYNNRYHHLEKDIELGQMPSVDTESQREASKTSADTGVDNPAFRESPTNGIQLQEIRFNITQPSPIPSPPRNTQILADVIVHNAPRPNSVQRSNSDARGFTQRRHRRSQGTQSYWDLYDAVEEAINSVNQQKKQRQRKTPLFRAKPKGLSQINDKQKPLFSLAKSLHDLNGQHARKGCQPEVIAKFPIVAGDEEQFSSQGPYCTRIGIYKSESDLYALRHHYVDMEVSDQSTTDSPDITMSDVIPNQERPLSSQV